MTICPQNRNELRDWLIAHSATEKEVWVLCTRSTRQSASNAMLVKYTDVVEEALCFGWIDSTVRKNPDGEGCLQRLSPRRKNSHWTELNIERCHQLMERGLMTLAGIEAMPQPRIS